MGALSKPASSALVTGDVAYRRMGARAIAGRAAKARRAVKEAIEDIVLVSKMDVRVGDSYQRGRGERV